MNVTAASARPAGQLSQRLPVNGSADCPLRVGYASCMTCKPGASGVPSRGTQCGQELPLARTFLGTFRSASLA